MDKRCNNIERNYTIEDLEELLDNIPYEVYLKSKDGKYKYINSAAADRVGKDKKDIIGKDDLQLRSPKMAKICVDSDKKVLKNGQQTFIEDKVIDGNIEISYEIVKTLLYNNKEEGVVIGGIAKFVSEDKTLSNIILQNSNTIINDLNIIMVYTEILKELKNTIYCDDICLYLYDELENKMKKNISLDKDEYIFIDEYSFDDKEKHNKNYPNKIIQNLDGDGVKYLYLLKNNNRLLGCVHIYYKKEPNKLREDLIRNICVMLSLIEMNKILNNNLKNELDIKNEMQKKLQMIIDGVIDVYAIVKKVGNEIVWLEISKRCGEVIGWTIEELNSKNYLNFIHEIDKKRIKSIIEANVNSASGKPFAMICKNEKWITIDAILNHLTEDIYMIVAKDVTCLTKLKKDKENLEHAVEIESLKGEFFANLSHEFKTPLNIILSTVQLIMNYIKINNEYPSMENFNRYLGNIKQNSYRLLKLANNMIDITKIYGNFYPMAMDNYNIVEVVENIVQSLVVYMKDNKRNIIFDTMEEEIITACDPDQIERIILNLLSNAMKFTTPDGNIYANIEVNDKCNKVIIRIGNDGQPISIEDSEKIFERFTQSENLLTRSIEGSGIGLSISKSLVELHKGIIYVNTEVKEGTEFCIELPIRRLKNFKGTNVREKSIVSKVEKFHIEFSDIYN